MATFVLIFFLLYGAMTVALIGALVARRTITTRDTGTRSKQTGRSQPTRRADMISPATGILRPR